MSVHWGRWLPLLVSPSVILAVCSDSFILADSLTAAVAWFKCVWAVKRPCTRPNSLVGYLPPDRLSIRSSQQQHHYCVCKANSVSLLSSTSWCQLMAGESCQPLMWEMMHHQGKKRLSSGIWEAVILQVLDLSCSFNYVWVGLLKWNFFSLISDSQGTNCSEFTRIIK